MKEEEEEEEEKRAVAEAVSIFGIPNYLAGPDQHGMGVFRCVAPPLDYQPVDELWACT